MNGRRRGGFAIGVLLLAGVAVWLGTAVRAAARPFPAPAQDEPRVTSGGGHESIVLAGGCFWGMQLVFEHVRGVISATPGYAGGGASTADYEDVSTGVTGHAESVQIVYDPSQVTLGDLLKVDFSVAMDPTQWNYQGPDHGPQYRSVIFTSNPQQVAIASAYIAQLSAAHVFRAPIVTQITALPHFYPAESEHQHFADRHPGNPYIVLNDRPKLDQLRRQWPQLTQCAGGRAVCSASKIGDLPAPSKRAGA